MYSCNTVKKLTHFPNFPANVFLVGVKKKHLHCTISRCLRTGFSKHSESKCLYILVNFCKKIFVPKMFEAFIWWGREIWVISLWWLIVWASQNSFKFHFDWIFGNWTIFQHFDTSINSTETVKFSGQFGHQG